MLLEPDLGLVGSDDVWIAASDGTKLRARLHSGTEPRGLVIISHGLGGHGERFEPLVHSITRTAGLADVVTFDYRGHGKSEGARGVVRRYEELVDDLDAIVSWSRRIRSNSPVFVMGHSNGGLVAILWLLEKRGALDGLILSNPALRMAVKVPFHKWVLGRLLLWFAPGTTLDSGIADDSMTKDPAYLEQLAQDKLRHSRISAPMFFGMIRNGELVRRRAAEITTPMLLFVGAADQVIDPAATLDFFEHVRSADKTLRVFPTGLHEPLNDAEAPEAIAEIENWLRARLG